MTRAALSVPPHPRTRLTFSRHRASAAPSFAGWTAALLILAWTVPGSASPNGSVGVTAAGGVSATEGGRAIPVFAAALRGEVILGRERDSDSGWGPYAEVGSVAFRTVDLGVGVTRVVPVIGGLAFSGSLGPMVRYRNDEWALGACTTGLLGSRSHNFHSAYGLSAGLLGQVKGTFTGERGVEALLGMQLDTALLALPFIAAWKALH